MQHFDPSSSPLVQCVNRSDTFMYYKGFFFEDNHIDYLVRIFPLQLSLIVVLQTALHFLLRRLGTTPLVAQILGGVLLGPTCFSKNAKFRDTIFPDLNGGGMQLGGTLGLFGSMLYLFLVGVKMDLSILIRSSRKEKSIGLLTFLLPFLLTLPVSVLLQKHNPEHSFAIMASMMSFTSFHSIVCFLSDLKIINTDLGRIAISASTMSSMSCLVVATLSLFSKHISGFPSSLPTTTIIGKFVSLLVLIIFITVVLRKVVIMMIQVTPRGEPIKELYIFIIFIMILGTGIIGEWLGVTAVVGPMILGFVIPNGPPVASTLVDKLDPFVSGLLLPLFFNNLGVKVNITFEIPKTYWIVMMFSSLSIIGKLIGTILPCLFYRMPFQDALTLGLILCAVGVYELQTCMGFRKVVGNETFSAMVLSTFFLASIISPLVRLLYNPSKRYIVYKKHTLQNLKHNAELRVLVCVYNPENVPTIVNILEASNPTKESPICIYLLHFIELLDHSTPLLINHKSHKKTLHDSTPSEHIINSFKIYEKQNQGGVFLLPFTSFTHFLSAHDDICAVSVDGQTSLIIIPFHKQWNIDGTTQTCKWVSANKKVLQYAPCSVGILIDRGVLKSAWSIRPSHPTYTIGVIFLGDADDREALCYAMRMAGNPNVYLTVYRLILVDIMMSNLTEKALDENVINEYKLAYKDSTHNLYKEEVVKDVTHIISVMRTMEDCHDLILIGKNHTSYSTIFHGLNEWQEYPELGVFGDMFASSDFKSTSSILVMQQHSCLTKKVITC